MSPTRRQDGRKILGHRIVPVHGSLSELVVARFDHLKYSTFYTSKTQLTLKLDRTSTTRECVQYPTNSKSTSMGLSCRSLAVKVPALFCESDRERYGGGVEARKKC